tara:strand:+ start:489 stop:1295 length:807 start_codon:yes stop_codon:yes gene_type:complete
MDFTTNLKLTRDIISTDRVNLEELDAFLTYLFVGFTLKSKFKLINGGSGTALSLKDAQKLKTQLQSAMYRKGKPFLRKMLSGFLIGLVQFSDQKGRGIPTAENVKNLKAFQDKLVQGNFTQSELDVLIEIADKGLSRTYYTTFLNNKLDPASSFFAGQTPNSFTHSLEEFQEYLRVLYSPFKQTPPPPQQDPPEEDPPEEAPPEEDPVDKDPIVYEINDPSDPQDPQVPQGVEAEGELLSKNQKYALWGTVGLVVSLAAVFVYRGSKK